MAFDQLIARLRRAMTLDGTAFEEVRDDATLLIPCLAAAAVAVLLAGFGAFLFGSTVLDDSPDGWFVDTFILGSIFTIILFAAGMGITYVVLSQVYRETMAWDALIRVLAVGYVPYALGLLVFIPEIGFAFGIFSVMAVFYYSIYGIRAAFPSIEPMKAMISVAAGFALWSIILLLVSGFPDDNFATGVFVYGLYEF